MIECDVAAVVVTLGDTPRLHQAISSIRSSVTNLDVSVICVINDPSASGNWQRDGVHYVGAGMNLGWAGGVHAGLIGVDSQYVWAIQDDMTVNRHALGSLLSEFAHDQSLAAVRPLNVSSDGRVHAFQQGNIAAIDGRITKRLPAVPTHPNCLKPIPDEGFLSSAGLLVRRDVWDATGGFDPWYFPWGHIDVDFGQTLKSSGWNFRTVLGAHFTHHGQTSTTTNFREMCLARHNYLYGVKWGLEELVRDPELAPVSPWIVESSRLGAGQPRNTDIETLRRISGIAAADLAMSASRWMGDELTYFALRQLVTDQSVRRKTTHRLYTALRGKFAQ